LHQEIVVDDLHAITPDEYIEYGEGVLHELSYQQARHFNRPARASTSRARLCVRLRGIPRASLITESVGSRSAVSTTCSARSRRLPEQAQVSVRFVTFDDPQSERQRIITQQPQLVSGGPLPSRR
jgi:pro-apoptotic serine protease NMA111